MEAALAVALFGTASLFDEGVLEEFSLGSQVFFSPEAPDPVEKLFRTAQDNMLAKRGGVSDASWDEALTPVHRSSAPPTGCLAKELGVVRTEIKVIDGDRWSHAFNAAGEMVGARLLYNE
jgi:hypothetical protein